MKTVGIIAEYNPFHNGHAYQIRQAKEATEADYCIVILSGNFVQRGVPAIMDKFLRTRIALLEGADIVIELPVHYSTGSAEYFASSAVALLDKLGVTDALCFGSECGDLHALSSLSHALVSESDAFKTRIKQEMKAGYSYPKARSDALSATAPQLTEYLDVLRFPNNILGLEYLKALEKRNSHIKAHTLSRVGTNYHDASLHTAYSSALAIRESIILKEDIRFIKEQVPPVAYELMEQNYQKTFPILPGDISSLLLYKLIQEEENGYMDYFDIDSHFSDRVSRHLSSYTEFEDFCELLKSKNITYTKVARNLLHILLNIYQKDVETYCAEDFVYYARMLGFRKDAKELLSAIKANSSIPLLSKLSVADERIASANGKKMLHSDIQASHIYGLIGSQKFRQPFQNECTKPPVVL
ncbi:MAG: nucleotidyltransferase [Muribaculaceae bacterium]|nr:nucleotidyltransferase [Muribaculaceae bacterium]